MARLSFSLRFTALSLDEAIGIVGDVRVVADWLPFRSVSPLKVTAGSIGFHVELGDERDSLPITVLRHASEWSGSYSVEIPTATDASDLLINLRVFLTVTSLINYIEASGWLADADDSTGFSNHRSVVRLVRSLYAGDGLPSGLSNTMRDFLLGRPNPLHGLEDDTEDGLAIIPLEVLLNILDQESA